jgi:hypothetical protein
LTKENQRTKISSYCPLSEIKSAATVSGSSAISKLQEKFCAAFKMNFSERDGLATLYLHTKMYG